MGVNVYTYEFVPPGPPFTASTAEKFAYAEKTEGVADLKDYPEQHEVLGIIFYTDTRLNEGHNVSVAVKFYNDDTNQLIWQGSLKIPQPSSEGWGWWNWYKVKFWIGKASWEINKPMLVRAELTVTGSPLVTQTFTRKVRAIDTTVVPPPPPPPPVEYKVLPEPPADFPAKFVPYYKELDLALFNKDAAEVLRILRAHAWETGSISFFAYLVSFPVVIGSITATLGSYAFIGFLFEESLQTLDMALFSAMSNKQWDLALDVVNKKEDFINEYGKANLIDYIPFINVVQASDRFREASTFKMEIDRKIIQRQIWRVVQPNPGDVVGYAKAIEAGAPAETFLPGTPALLRVNVNAPGGTIVVDGLGYSTMFPFEIGLASGSHTVEVGAEGKIGISKSVFLDPYEDKIVDFYLESAPPPPPVETKGSLTVNSTPAGAKIYIDDVYTFEITNTTLLVEAGSRKLTLKLKDYTDWSQTFAISAGESKTISADLVPITVPPPPPPPPIPEEPAKEIIIPLEPAVVEYNAWKVTIRGVDSVTGEELGAAILINDIYMDKYTPYWFYFQPLATYNIKLRKKGYRQGEVTVTTDPLPTA